jgi:hypothetical protein
VLDAVVPGWACGRLRVRLRVGLRHAGQYGGAWVGLLDRVCGMRAESGVARAHRFAFSQFG